MKLILTGATGFIGAEVLRQALDNPAFEAVLVLSRRPLKDLSSSSHPKLTTSIVEDFTRLSSDTLAACAGADACIWALGSVETKDLEAAKKVNLDYTIAAAKEFVRLVGAGGGGGGGGGGRPFKLLYTSGMLAIREQDSSPWFLPGFRKLRGEVENQLLALAEESKGSLEVQIARPGFVIRSSASYLVEVAMTPLPHVKVDDLAAAMIDCIVNPEPNRILHNASLVEIGRKVQKGKKTSA